MPLKPPPHLAIARPQALRARAGAWLACCALSACAATPLPPAAPGVPPVSTAVATPTPASQQAAPAPVSVSAATPAPAPAPLATPAAPPAPATGPSIVSAEPATAPEAAAAARLLRYADRLRGLSPAELSLEIAALGDPAQQPERQLQLSLALAQLNQPVETARALGLAQRVANSLSPESAPLKPLARLLAQRLMEHRKIEETLDKQNNQLRDQQRRLEQLNERLEAMRAIERSINARPPTAAPRAPITP